MTQTTRWWWVRHAKALDYDGRVYGSTIDVAVDTGNPAPFRALADHLPQNAVLVRTTLRRTRQTADAICAQGFQPADTQIAKTMGELSFGDWQGMTYEKLNEISGGHPVWFTPLDVTPPNGESFLQMRARVIAGIQTLTKEHAGRDIVSISHGGPIRAAIGHALGLTPERSVCFRVENLSLTQIEFRHDAAPNGGSWHIGCINKKPDALGHQDTPANLSL